MLESQTACPTRDTIHKIIKQECETENCTGTVYQHLIAFEVVGEAYYRATYRGKCWKCGLEYEYSAEGETIEDVYALLR